MKYSLTSTLAALVVTASTVPSFADTTKIVWGGGNPSASTYTAKYVPTAIDALSKLRLAGYEWGGPTQGTLDNVERVRANPTHLAVGQADMVRGVEGITILHENVGPECLYVITKEEGYENLGHVIGNAWDLTVVTGGEKSGSFGTWQVMSGIYDDFADMPVVHAGSTDKIISAVKKKSSSIGFFVMRPDPNSKVFEAIEDAGLNFIPVVDFALEEIYEFYSLKVAHSGFAGLGAGQFVETACTSVSLFTGVPEAIEGVRDEVTGRDLKRLEATLKRVATADPEDFTPSTKDFSDMFSGMTKIASKRIAELGKSAKETAEAAIERASN